MESVATTVASCCVASFGRGSAGLNLGDTIDGGSMGGAAGNGATSGSTSGGPGSGSTTGGAGGDSNGTTISSDSNSGTAGSAGAAGGGGVSGEGGMSSDGGAPDRDRLKACPVVDPCDRNFVQLVEAFGHNFNAKTAACLMTALRHRTPGRYLHDTDSTSTGAEDGVARCLAALQGTPADENVAWQCMYTEGPSGWFEGCVSESPARCA